ncbi:dihydrolipoamide acetyltransferase family protein [Alkaliphilus peptidifermentans]|uniref:Dihydrolipoamide acetyltransferase component of pyruvate dehydrogenase complex n=1 Tax=Alkaliphilus peptidifermentans DSM 18978 TaxID=1120976 RepID=A0A1G5L116_9FIRM|nr:dihydrolipoamide acetyltransferase family protein [Alkaliphilus peptidifermentans]SCZ06506.1 pyruvate dehydrogenase E2 component (dihydrolipoamide acetyltransferase) [Alkaliphilus peptidifermentans DSM 18978]
MLEFKFADIGEGIHEGKILKWMVKVGDKVKDGDSLFLVETDKVNAEIPSPAKGEIIELLAEAGDVIHVGQVVVKIDDGSTESKPKKEPVSEDEEQSAGVVGELTVSSQIIEESKESAQQKATEDSTRALATPVARRLAKDLGIGINKIDGTGPAGRVMKEDIYRFKEELDNASGNSKVDNSSNLNNEPQRIATEREERVPLTMLRKTIAKNMVLSKSVIPHAAAMDEIDVTDLVKFREKAKETATKEAVKLTYMPFIIKALTLTLKEYTTFNGSYDEEKEEIIIKKYYNIGIATDTPDGLLVPVIKDTDKKGLFEVANELSRLAEGARNKTLTIKDLQEGTISITNYGAVGAGSGIPVIKHPEVAILGVGKITKKPVVIDGEITIRDIMAITLCIDHRVIDGGDAGRFIQRFKEYLSNPMLLILS